MPIGPCKECKNPVALSAEKCPNCGNTDFCLELYFASDLCKQCQGTGLRGYEQCYECWGSGKDIGSIRVDSRQSASQIAKQREIIAAYKANETYFQNAHATAKARGAQEQVAYFERKDVYDARMRRYYAADALIEWLAISIMIGTIPLAIAIAIVVALLFGVLPGVFAFFLTIILGALLLGFVAHFSPKRPNS